MAALRMASRGVSVTSEMFGEVFSDRQIASILDAIGQPALAVREGLVTIAANPIATQMLDMELSGQHMSLALRAPAILKAVEETIETGRRTTAEHHVNAPVRKSLSVRCSRLGVTSEGHAIALVILHDLTYQEQVERMRADFVANASHELRTPLTSLMGFIETMQGPAREDAIGRDKFLALMKAQADRMARLINDLLSLSRIEVNEHVQPSAVVDLASLTRQAVGLLTPLAESVSCVIELEAPPVLAVRGDGGELTQAIYNLVENALKYGAQGKLITITARLEQGEVALHIRDRGPGIAAHHVPRLTERFYRVSTQDSRSRGGTGLGLAIVKHIINRHRGKLAISSELGQGSTFSIFMPSAK